MKNLTKKLILTSLMALMAFSSAFGQNGTLRAKFVKSNNGNPVTDATFRARNTANTYYTSVLTPDPQGETQWSVPPGDYIVYLVAGNYSSIQSSVVTVSAGQTNSYFIDNPLVVVPHGTIQARFLKSTDNSPVTDAQFRASNSAIGYYSAAKTPTAQGDIEWKVPPGNYQVSLYSGSYSSASVSITVVSEQINSNITSSPMLLTPLAGLHAKLIKSTDLSNVANYTFSIRKDANTHVKYVTTNANGEFSTTLNPGFYWLDITNEYVTQKVGDFEVLPNQVNETYYNTPIVVTPKAKLKAKFINSVTQLPVSGITVLPVNATTGIITYANTLDANGTAEWSLDPGNYYIKWHTGPYAQFQTATVQLTAGNTNSLLFDSPTALVPLSTLRAKFIKGSDGSPITDASFRAVNTTTGDYSIASTPNSQGEIEWTVNSGNCYIQLYSGNYVTYNSPSMYISPGTINTAFVDTPRVLTPLGVKAHFVNSNNTAVISGKTVKITDGSNNTVATQNTNANGDVLIQLAPGSYTMKAFDNDVNYQTQNIPITITSSALLDKGTINMAQNVFALSFDGVGDYVDAGNDASLGTVTSAITIETWILRKTGGSNSQHVISKGGGWGNTGFNLHFYSTGGEPNMLRFEVRGSGALIWDFYNVVTNIGYDQWHHLAVVWDKNTMPAPKVIIDGTLVYNASGDYTGTINASSYNLFIGRNSGINGGDFKGNLDEVRLWNVARTQAEIQASMSTHLSGSESGLLAYYKTDEGTGSLINDIAGANSQGALMGNTSWLSTTFPHISGTMTKILAGIFYESAYTDTTGEMKKDLSTIPMEFGLESNFPNPFNPTTTLRYALKEDVRVSLKVYNLLGQEVRNLVNEYQSAGFKNVLWDGKNNQGKQVPSGVYIYRLEAGSFKMSKKMNLIK